ncbi:MAG TPA: helix-turn-helix domain-containing protein [Rhodocyclaceae bacterium]|nr:helix-turn-helix domain-containing protein [Rhodocyclaceae bacterium]
MSHGRPLEFDPRRALLAALEVFWRQGFEATSLNDLLRAMGISRSSFYQAFGSKHALFERCLAAFRERQVERMTRALEQAPSGKAFLRASLQALVREAADGSLPKGCLIMNTATEFAGRDPAVARLVSDGTGAFAEVFRAAVVRAQAEGEIAAERDAAVLARYMVSTISGLRTMVKAGLPPAAVEEVVEVALGAL